MSENETLKDVAQQLRKLSARGLMDALERAAFEYALEAEAHAKDLMTTKLKPRTGRLRASVNADVRRTGSSVKIVLRAGHEKKVPYAATHEFGETITAPSGKALRLPLPRALTARGVDRFPPPLRQTGGDQFFFKKSKKGEPLLWNKKDNKPWYILKKSVTIPARPTMGPTFDRLEKQLIPELRSVIESAVEAGDK